MTALVWFRDDLRLADHGALTAGAAGSDGVIALYVLDEQSDGIRPLGAAARWWLHQSLQRLGESLAQHGVPLILRRGPAAAVVPAVAAESGATHVYWNRRYGLERHLDARIMQTLRDAGTTVATFPGGLLFEPETITTGAGAPYRVYSPFWRACLARSGPPEPLPVPERLGAAAIRPAGDDLTRWQLQPASPDRAAGMAERWTPGEAQADHRLEGFLADTARYPAGRDFPAADSGSELSPHLRWGEVSPRTVWHRALAAGGDVGVGEFLAQLGWREFAGHTAFHHPDIHLRPLDRRFDAFTWRHPDADELAAWQRGRTGFPLVDAGMRELWGTGFMHNRVRMVTASFLTKNLLLDWRHGEAWFWDALVDADAASNPFNWQWVAGCGADAAPYFRIFNPTTQREKFDPAGEYVRRWAPDSAAFPEMVELRGSRARALAAYDAMRHGERISPRADRPPTRRGSPTGPPEE